MSEIGRGAVGVVYKSYDCIIERYVAIKLISVNTSSDADDTMTLERFRREAKAAGRLSNSGIVSIYDFWEYKNVAYIVMEYVDGPTLRQIIDNRTLSIEDSVKVTTGVLDALAHSHKNGIVHRDIKPSNIMINSIGHVKIADFGIARIDKSNMTKTGTIIGTPSYMSPEQLKGEHVDARSDIFSVGIILYEMLTGHKPFKGTVATVMNQILHFTPSLPSRVNNSIPSPFDNVISRAMAKKKEKRYQSAEEFSLALVTASHDDYRNFLMQKVFMIILSAIILYFGLI